ncbi:MAG: hypothetical protein JWO76_2634 [Nocardioides sp.]|nr:hypothetical protein [Nocardioides sp.]
MQPIPETVRAIEELGPFAHRGDLLEELTEMGRRVATLVPDCVGMSLVSAAHGVTFTLLASDQQLALLDALHRQPGQDEEPPGEVARAEDDLLDEEAWRLLALSSAARCVLSTLTLPLRGDARISGAVSLYGASRQAFAGHHRHLAEILGAWAPGAVTNADLSFSTLREAEQAPRWLQRASTIDQAAQLVAAVHAVAIDTARVRIHEAAERAGITEEQLAEAVIRLGGL